MVLKGYVEHFNYVLDRRSSLAMALGWQLELDFTDCDRKAMTSLRHEVGGGGRFEGCTYGSSHSSRSRTRTPVQ